jgi:RNA polymerase sigma-70 factor, ECF subfamily
MAPPAAANASNVAAPDRETIEACRRGDARALETVLGEHAPELERLLGRILGPGGEIEDVLQDTLEAAIRGFARYRGDAPVKIWLARIAVRTAYHHLRHPSRRRRAALELVADTAAETARPDDTAHARRLLERVYRHLSVLSPKSRIAFVLHVVEGRSIEEVTALTGSSAAAVKSRVFMARHRLVWRAERDPALQELSR